VNYPHPHEHGRRRAILSVLTAAAALFAAGLTTLTTGYETGTRITTLLHDTQYPTSPTWQNTAYIQPPHPSFYIGDGMATAPRPAVYTP
jgi:hypothetical protein